MRVSVPLRKAWRLINHGPTTLIATAAGSRRDVMAAAWVVALDYDPPKLAAVVAGDSFTRELLEASGEMVVSLPTAAIADLTFTVGSVSGREVDKFAAYAIDVAPASIVAAPLVEGCAAWLECRIVDEPRLAAEYDLFIAEIVAAWADDASWDGETWSFASDGARTIHHVSKGVFLATGNRIVASKLEGRV